MVAGLRDRRRPRPAPLLRPDDRRRQRALRPDRPARRLLGRRLRRVAAARPRSAPRRPRRSGCSAVSTTRSRRSRWASSTPSCRSSASRRRRCSGAARCSRSPPSRCGCVKASFHAHEDGYAGHPAARARREPPLLRLRRGRGGPRGLQGEAHARLLAVPAAAREREHLGVRIWLMAARPRTLPAGVAPVLVGTALARRRATTSALGASSPRCSARCSSRSATNLSNDYSDARRGADTEDRLGPVRVTAGGLVPPRQVLIATYVTFGAGGAVRRLPDRRRRLGDPAVGVASILAGVLYTGGPRPYGYEGLGEVFVFLFFGVVAVAGSYFAQIEALAVGGVRARGPGRPARRGDPRRQQRPRHGHRPPRRQAHARRAARPRARPLALRGDGLRRVPRPARPSGPPAASTSGRGSCCPGWRCRSPCGSSGPCASTPTARRSTARWPGPGCCSSCSACCSSAGLLLTG